MVTVDEHEYWREQSDLYALGVLHPRDQEKFEAHLNSACDVCETYLHDTREALTLLLRTLPPATPPVAVKERVFQAIVASKVVSAASMPKEAHGWRRVVGTIAAGIIGMAVTAAYYDYTYRSRFTAYDAVIALLRDPDTRDHILYGTGPSPSAMGRFLWNQSGDGHIFVTNLPVPPAGKTYAVWTIPQSSVPRYVGALQTDAGGRGGLHVKSSGDSRVETFAVTLEPAGMIAAPTGPIVLTSKRS
jgi:anti-sigma-K factor RskA